MTFSLRRSAKSLLPVLMRFMVSPLVVCGAHHTTPPAGTQREPRRSRDFSTPVPTRRRKAAKEENAESRPNAETTAQASHRKLGWAEWRIDRTTRQRDASISLGANRDVRGLSRHPVSSSVHRPWHPLRLCSVGAGYSPGARRPPILPIEISSDASNGFANARQDIGTLAKIQPHRSFTSFQVTPKLLYATARLEQLSTK